MTLSVAGAVASLQSRFGGAQEPGPGPGPGPEAKPGTPAARDAKPEATATARGWAGTSSNESWLGERESAASPGSDTASRRHAPLVVNRGVIMTALASTKCKIQGYRDETELFFVSKQLLASRHADPISTSRCRAASSPHSFLSTTRSTRWTSRRGRAETKKQHPGARPRPGRWTNNL